MAIKIALVQMHVEPGQVARNLSRAEERIAEAAAEGARIVLLPECLDTGWGHPCTLEQAEPIPAGSTARRLAEAAQRHQVYVCAGISERESGRDEDRFYNAAILLSPRGELLAHHRKLNELEMAHALYAQGDRLSVARTELGAIGVMICADANARDHVLTQALCYMGADIILSPTAWAVPPDHDNVREPYGDLWRHSYSPICRDYRVWILGVSNVGPVTSGEWAGWKCIGCSLVMAPGGREVLQGPYGENAEALLYVDVEPEPRPTRGVGWHGYWGRQRSGSE
jgi:predicted amidohydrolase